MVERFLIVGLGNPGRKYAKTPHNAGFWVVDELARRYATGKWVSERKALVTDATIDGRRVLLAKPQTFMNLSGEAVRALTDYYKIDADRLMVVYDDMDTPLGTLRLRKTGGHGGQNGMRNILMHLSSKDFARLRFGIGRPPGQHAPVNYLLTPLSGDLAILADQVTSKAADAVEAWLKSGIDAAMNQFNGDVLDKAPAPKQSPEDELEIARRAHELAPRDPKPLEKMARLYKRLRDLERAAETHLKIAEIHKANGRIKPMVAEWERAVAVRPSLVAVQENIARTYENSLGDIKRAAQSWLRLAEYHLKNDQMTEALIAIEEALRVNPQHPKALDLHQEIQSRLLM